MVACLAVLPRLKSFIIEFQSATPRPNRISPPPVTRSVLPALTYFRFRGASEYLEDLVAPIDCPQLDCVEIEYLNQLRAGVTFFSDPVFFEIDRHEIHLSSLHHPVRISIFCQEIDWQLSHIAQVVSDVSLTLSNVDHLMLATLDTYREQLMDTDDVGWLHLLHRFTAVQTLHVLSPEIAGHVALALEDNHGGDGRRGVATPQLDLLIGPVGVIY